MKVFSIEKVTVSSRSSTMRGPSLMEVLNCGRLPSVGHRNLEYKKSLNEGGSQLWKVTECMRS